ncbi:hypothetical protein BJ912DRAFT_1008192 [Pholiota molesta]|nr:hypothetical protein BJ912DRAFT_1008192 [Pholiota molesta]
MASTTLYVHVDLSNTLGALEIGSLFAIFIFGIVTLQMYTYYTTFGKDLWYYKALIGHTLGVSYEMYRDTIVLYGEPQLLTRFQALGSTTAIGGVITLLVQGFFAMRLFHVLPKPYSYVGIFCVLLSLVRCVAAFYLTSQALTLTSVTEYRDRMGSLITTLLVVGAAIDVIIAGSMLYYLAKKRNQGLQRFAYSLRLVLRYLTTGIHRIASVIDRLIAYTIQSLLTHKTAHILILPSAVYSNSLLSSLNSRQDLRDQVSISVSSERQSRGKGSHGGVVTIDRSHIAFNTPQVISIEMKTTTETAQDCNTDPKSGLNQV